MDHFAYDGKGHLSIQFWADLQPHFTDGHVSRLVNIIYISLL